MNIKKWLDCGKVLNKGFVEYKEYNGVNDIKLTIKDVPTYVCKNCGDEFFISETMYILNKAMNDIIDNYVVLPNDVTVNFKNLK